VVDDAGYDETLAHISNEERLAFFNSLAAGLETADVKLSGIFSNGSNVHAQINTRSPHTQYFQTSDAQVTTVLSHATLKWEVTAEQSAQRKTDLKASLLHEDLRFLVDHYQHDTPQQIPLGSYDIVFGTAATADLLNFMNYICHNGGLMKRGFSFMSEDKVGQKIFSEKFTLADDPGQRETFPYQADFTGMTRKKFPIITRGVFNGFIWYQDDADEFSAKPTGHTVPHRSIMMSGGEVKVKSLKDLVAMPRKKDILYIPFLHYMNIVNPSKGIITGSSRFGALLLKADGSVVVPYNVRLTQSLLDLFGDKVAWLSQDCEAYNTSLSYGARNPTAISVPRFMQVDGLEISHSNASY
jgi:predicted Zn-dependent protease